MENNRALCVHCKTRPVTTSEKYPNAKVCQVCLVFAFARFIDDNGQSLPSDVREMTIAEAAVYYGDKWEDTVLWYAVDVSSFLRQTRSRFDDRQGLTQAPDLW